MSGSARVLVRRRAGIAGGEHGREPLVEALDGHLDAFAQRLDELLTATPVRAAP